MKFVKNAQEPITTVSLSLFMKEIVVESGDLELTITNFPEYSAVDESLTDQIKIRMWASDKEIDFDLPEEYLDNLRNLAKLTKEERETFLNRRYETFLRLLVEYNKEDKAGNQKGFHPSS